MPINGTPNPVLSHVTIADRWIQWARIEDFREGSDQVKRQGQAYLPAPTGFDMETKEGKAQYDAYKEGAQVYEVIDRTVDGMVGVSFQQQPQYDIPNTLKEVGVLDSFTIDGESADTLAKLCVDQLVSLGRFGMLIDLPEEETTDPRPYASKYFAYHIWNWKREFINGKQVTTMVQIQDGQERVGDRDGIRFLRLLLENPSTDPTYVIEEWVFDQKLVLGTDKIEFSNEFALREPTRRMPEVLGNTLDFIPFVFVNPKSLQPEIEKPPMLPLADLMKGHYKNSAQYEHCLYTGAHDTFIIFGDLLDEQRPRAIGGGRILILPGEASVDVWSSPGTSMESNLEAMQHKEKQAASIGARLIFQQQGQPETAEAVRLNSRQNSSVLVNSVDQAEAAMTRALQYMAIMRGLSQEQVDSIEVAFNRDFIESRLTLPEIKQLVEVWQTGGVDKRSYFQKAKAGGLFPKDVDFEEWEERQREDATNQNPEPETTNEEELEDADE